MGPLIPRAPPALSSDRAVQTPGPGVHCGQSLVAQDRGPPPGNMGWVGGTGRARGAGWGGVTWGFMWQADIPPHPPLAGATFVSLLDPGMKLLRSFKITWLFKFHQLS